MFHRLNSPLECYNQQKIIEKRSLFIILHFTQYGCGVHQHADKAAIPYS